MNQQRSRRFRAAQEAADKEEERREAIKLFEAMGQTVSEEAKNKKSWDSNAITPGKLPRFDRDKLTSRYSFHGSLVGKPKVLGILQTLDRSRMEKSQSHLVRRFGTRRRRAQDCGLDSKTEESPYLGS